MTSLLQELHLMLGTGDPNPVIPIVLVVELDGHVRPGAMHRALTAVVERHDALRLRFPVHMRPCHAVLDNAATGTWDMTYHDLTNLPHADQQATLDQLIAELGDGLDLAAGPVFRTMLGRLRPRRWVLGVAIDHVVFDAGSVELLWRDLAVAYRVACGYSAGTVPPAPAYLDRATAERAELGRPSPGPRVAYWLDELDRRRELMPRLRLREEFLRRSSGVGPMHMEETILPVAVWEGVQRSARHHRTTPYLLLLSGTLAALRRLSVGDAVGLRIPVRGRRHRADADAIGLFAPSMPLFVHVSEAERGTDIIDRVRRRFLPLVDNAIPLVALRAYRHEIGGLLIDNDEQFLDAVRVPHAALIAQTAPGPAPAFDGLTARVTGPPRRAGASASPVVTIGAACVRSSLRLSVTVSLGVYTADLPAVLLRELAAELAALQAHIPTRSVTGIGPQGTSTGSVP